MKEKKKLIILTSVILGVLVVVLGLTYAAFTYDRVGNNSDLVLGDIYMHYKENNQLMFNDVMPTSIDKYTTYKVNPVMATQEIVDNELSRCISIYTDFEYEFDAGSTAESFCKGTGTAFGGMTIQDNLYV